MTFLVTFRIHLKSDAILWANIYLHLYQWESMFLVNKLHFLKITISVACNLLRNYVNKKVGGQELMEMNISLQFL